MSKEFGERLKKLRLKKGYYQSDLAAELEVVQAFISKLENGNKEPSVETIIKLCDILNTNPNYLLGYDNNAPNIKKEDLIQIPMPQDKEE